MNVVDLNCDIGEGFGPYRIGNDAELMNFVTSVNIACGFHGGDPHIMRETVQLALEKNIGIGAHPGLPDLNGFGRREMNISPQEAYDLVIYQIGALDGFVRSEGGKLQHVKPHGALYNMAAKNGAIAKAIAEAIYKFEPELILFGLSGSELIGAGQKIGLRTGSEVFADRTYCEDGSLTPRSEANSLIHDAAEAVKQVTRMVTEGTVKSIQGVDIKIKAETICLHGDGHQAVFFAKRVVEGLTLAGINLKSAGHFL